MKTYVPNDYAKQNPIRIVINGLDVGVGRAISIVPPPPALPYIVREATPKEYEILFHRGHKNLIYEYDNKQGSEAEIGKPNPGNA